jgi:hypothetical protein
MLNSKDFYCDTAKTFLVRTKFKFHPRSSLHTQSTLLLRVSLSLHTQEHKKVVYQMFEQFSENVPMVSNHRAMSHSRVMIPSLQSRARANVQNLTQIDDFPPACARDEFHLAAAEQ